MNELIPPNLYKYQPFDHYALINLIKRQFYFSKPENFNDPYDCDPPFEITKAHRTEKNITALYDRVRNWSVDKSSFDKTYLRKEKPNKRFERDYLDSTNPIKRQIHDKVGATCFSEKVDDILLWSHYGDKHKGFCLEFDARIPIMEGQQETKLYKVTYPKSNSYRRLNILDILYKPDVLEVLLTTKSYHWHYEKEWRIFCNTGGDKLFRFNSKALTGVYFGYKMSQEDKDVIISVLPDNSEKNAPSDLATLAKNYPNTMVKGIQIFDMVLNKEKIMVSPFPFRPNYRE